MTLSLEPLGPKTLDAFGELLGSTDFGGCFCAVWTAFGPDWGERCEDPTRPNLAETQRRVLAKEHVGFLVREAGEVVGWTGSGPKTSFPLLAAKLGSRLSESDPQTWSVGCVAIRADQRGAGLSLRIIQAVVAEAGRHGASAVEAYPTRPWDEPRSYRGSRSTFERAGFVEVGSEPDGEAEILLMRRDLGGPAQTPG